jgi:hypothetical protein
MRSFEVIFCRLFVFRTGTEVTCFQKFNKTGNVRTNVKLRCVRVTTVAVDKAISITYPGYVFVALITQHTLRARCIILSSAACPAVPCFSTLPHRISTKKEPLNIKCALICSINFVRNLCHSKNSARYYHRRTKVFM